MLRVLSRERYCSRTGERGREPGEHGEVGVERDLREPTDAKQGEGVLVLQAAKLALNGGASSVEVAPPFRLTRDERVEPVGLDPDCVFGAWGSTARKVGYQCRPATSEPAWLLA